MNQQYSEPGVTREQLAKIIGRPVGSEDLISGGRFVNFEAGWAIRIMPATAKAHLFKKSGKYPNEAFTLCGLRCEVELLFAPGNFPHCQKCTQVGVKRNAV